MSSSSFIIEIPERPHYVPGSGPPLAPITLAPDNTDTGWVLVDFVDVAGAPRYIVAPKNDPVLRKAVKPDLILDWVSPRVFEEFEYIKYKTETWLEEERKAKKLAKALAKKNAKRLAEVLARTQHIGGQHHRLQSRSNKYHSSTGVESDSLSRGSSVVSSNMRLKRKIENCDDSGSVKRQAIINIEAQPEQAPILPPTRRPLSTFSGPEPGLSRLQPSNHPPNRSILKETLSNPISHRSKVETAAPSIVNNSQLPPKSSPHSHANGWDQNSTHTLKKAYPTILPPVNNNRQVSKSVPHSISKGFAKMPILPPSNNMRKVLSNALLKNDKGPRTYSKPQSGSAPAIPQSRDSSPSEGESAQASSWNRKSVPKNPIASGRSQGFWVPSSLARSKALDMSFFMSSISGRSRRSLPTKVSELKCKPVPGSEHDLVSENSSEEDENSSEEDESEEAEETWEIKGILSSSRRHHPTTGEMVKQYLIDWAGDYEPTWEPEENVSDDAIALFEAEQESKIGVGDQGNFRD